MPKGDLTKVRAALEDARLRLKNGEEFHVHFSPGNKKMGAIPSVSLLPNITCPPVCNKTCAADCYALKIANLRPVVMRAYAENTALLTSIPERYWAEVKAKIAKSRYFRFHVSGDMMGMPYLKRIVQIAKDYPGTDILVFTKMFNTVNQFIKDNGELPSNLHLLFSGWYNLIPDNPYHLPETNLFNAEHPPKPEWKLCGGNCYECACTDSGCWTIGKGETISFHQH